MKFMPLLPRFLRRCCAPGLILATGIAIGWTVPKGQLREQGHLPDDRSTSAGVVQVVRILDGDTFVARVSTGEVKVRLIGVDAPESKQLYGPEAKAELSALLSTPSLRIDEQGKDCYGRTLARVYAGGVCVNQELVRQGAAWVYEPTKRKYDAELVNIQSQAQYEHIGLWALAEQTAPDVWRRARKIRHSENGGSH